MGVYAEICIEFYKIHIGFKNWGPIYLYKCIEVQTSYINSY